MVDFFLLLILPGSGDDLQGIKRGIVELADLIVVNKADGDRRKLARQTQRDFAQALHLFPPSDAQWTVHVRQASAFENEGIDDIWTLVSEHHSSQSEAIQHHRAEQNAFWLDSRFRDLARSKILSLPGLQEQIEIQKQQLIEGKQSLTAALQQLDQELNRHFPS
jgi:LAO/AO transport system kinase